MAIVLKSNGSLKTKIELTSAHSSKRKKIDIFLKENYGASVSLNLNHKFEVSQFNLSWHSLKPNVVCSNNKCVRSRLLRLGWGY